MKCTNCSTLNPDDARFCKQCGSPLTAESKLDSSIKLSALKQSAPRALQDKLRKLPAPVIGERKSITILFTDIVGSTSLAEGIDPEDWKEIVSGAHQHVSDCVYRYEGHIAQLLGDGVLAFFGAPIMHEDDPVRAVQAALDIQAAIHAYADQLRVQKQLKNFQMRVSVNSGPVVVDQVGSDRHTEYLAVGDAVNLAARMQSAAQPGRVLLSENTFRSVAHVFECADLGSIEVKGKSKPIHVFEVQRTKAQPTSPRGIAGLESKMVGRDEQLKLLRRADRVVETEKSGRVAIVIGEPGMGKSRLIAEWRTAASRNSDSPKVWRWVEGHCLSYGQGLAYHLLVSVLRSVLGLSDNSPEDETQQALSSVAQDLLGESAQEYRPFLANLLAMKMDSKASTNLRQLNPQTLQAQYLAALRHLLLSLAERSPVAFIFEDIHWADQSSIELLSKLLPLTLESPVLFCFTTRPDHQSPGWKLIETAQQLPGDRLTELTLTALSPIDSQQLISNLLNIDSLPDDLRSLILAKSEGNPFFVEEVIRLLIDRGAIVQQGTVWSATQEIRTIEVPDTLQRLLLARIDRLVDELKRTLRVASVIGRQFPFDVLHFVLTGVQEQVDRGALSDDLAALEDTGLILSTVTQHALEYLFRHALVQEAAYEAVLKADRRSLHRAVGHAIETLFPTRLDELASTLAFHYERGEEWELAVQWIRRAGDRAFAQWALPEAADLFRRALAVLKQLPAQADVEFELRFKLAQAMMVLGVARDETLAEFERCLALVPNQHRQAEVYYQMGQLLHIYTSSDLSAAERFYTQALNLLRNDTHAERYGTIIAYLGYLYRYQDRIPQSIETLERALELAKQLESAELKANAFIFLSGAYLDAGRENDALTASLQGLELAESIGNLEMIGLAHSFCADVYLSRAYTGRGSPSEALLHIEEMRRHGREYGVGVLSGFGAESMAIYYELTGKREAALECWREGARVWLISHAPTRAAYSHTKCGQLLLQQGQLQSAAEAFVLARQACGSEYANRAELLIGLAYAGAGLESEACEHLQRAFDTASSVEQQRGWINMIRTDAEFIKQRSLSGVSALLNQYEPSP